MPFENVLSNLGFKKITQGYQSFSADNRRDIIRFNNYSFMPLICYEIIYSGQINYNEKNYDFILNISEDGWFGNSIGPYQHYSHAIFRSIEEGKIKSIDTTLKIQEETEDDEWYIDEYVGQVDDKGRSI